MSKMAELKISIPYESTKDNISEIKPCGSYTPIDDLGEDAMCDNYILYNHPNAIPVKVTIDEAIQIIIESTCHRYKSIKNM
jgi:hypothetical protein